MLSVFGYKCSMLSFISCVLSYVVSHVAGMPSNNEVNCGNVISFLTQSFVILHTLGTQSRMTMQYWMLLNFMGQKKAGMKYWKEYWLNELFIYPKLKFYDGIPCTSTIIKQGLFQTFPYCLLFTISKQSGKTPPIACPTLIISFWQKLWKTFAVIVTQFGYCRLWSSQSVSWKSSVSGLQAAHYILWTKVICQWVSCHILDGVE